jgi:hypothetical protein
MAILERLDLAISNAHSDGRGIIEVDITTDDYAELMTFAAQFDSKQLEELQLNMLKQTYCGYALVINGAAPESGILRDDGSEALPNDAVAHQGSRIAIGEALPGNR